MDKLYIALLGFGNVGQGVWSILNTNKEEICNQCGFEIVIKKILVRDLTKKRSVDVPTRLMTQNFNDILEDDDIGIVVELMGGADPAMEYMLESMKTKKHVVTANKLAIAKNGEQLFKTSEEEGVHFYFEASVGGGIPVIREISESLTANKIERIIGIINGTTNYILTKMTVQGMGYDEALKQAQDLGFAEADPTSDVDGYDASYKLAIMSSLAFRSRIDSDLIYREGIRKISALDMEMANKFGYVIKLLAIGKEKDNKLELRVHPAMIPKNHPLAGVNDSFNSILIRGNAVGDIMLSGRGAGSLPTGSAVVGDIISIIRNNFTSYEALKFKNKLPQKEVIKHGEYSSSFYINMSVKDHPGVLGEISAIFGQNSVSITSVTHTNRQGDSLALIFMTHDAKDGDVNHSIAQICNLKIVNSVDSVIRIETLE